ncbi:hypothetical protein WN944_026850 [Citrus x changshan-huyou]|uniref:Uncharacterized protein n=1 Tax=Citrus x changshan-huyou TaxID=2935761 RepID=A0AAP0QCE2_9ROSI
MRRNLSRQDDRGLCLSRRLILHENILEHMAKGNIDLLVMEDLAEENDQVERKMADMEKRMIQGIHMVMVKTGNVRNSDPFITLILCPKIFGLRMLEVWTVDNKNSSELCQQSVVVFCATMEISDVIDNAKKLLDLVFGKVTFSCFEVFLLSFPILSSKNSKIEHTSLSTNVEKTNGCDGFMISGRDNLDFDRRYGYGMVMD